MILDSKKEKLILDHLDLVLKANQTHNLTAIDNYEEALVLHIKDSLSGLDEFNQAPNGKYIDLGSGAGYPGIPLAIASERQTVLVESVTKKADCLKYFIESLKLNDISVVNDRIESLTSKTHKRYAVATARALSSIPSLLELASPLLFIDGILICYKGKDCEDEIKRALNLKDKFGMEQISNRIVNLIDDIDHRIIVYKKIQEPKIKLPRKFGFAQKKPLA